MKKTIEFSTETYKGLAFGFLVDTKTYSGTDYCLILPFIALKIKVLSTTEVFNRNNKL